MDHNEIRHMLSEYIDEAVTPAERAAIEKHLAVCSECTTALQELRKTIGHVREVEEIEPPAWLTAKVMARVQETSGKGRGSLLAFLEHFAVLRPVRVVAVLFLVVIAYAVYKTAPVREKLAESPVDTTMHEAARKPKSAEKEKKAAGDLRRLRKKQEEAVEQKPAYRSLDMKYAYEKPAPPEPAETMATEAGRPRPAPRSAQAPQTAGPGLLANAPQAASPAPASIQPMQDKLESRAAGRSAGKTVPVPAAEDRAEERESAPAEAPRSPAQGYAAREPSDRERLTRYFEAHDLPGEMQAKGLIVSVRQLGSGSAELKLVDEAVRRDIAQCGNSYVIEARLASRRMRYFYCFAPRIVLVAKYEFRHTQWIRKK